jgi:hypothetical protein
MAKPSPSRSASVQRSSASSRPHRSKGVQNAESDRPAADASVDPMTLDALAVLGLETLPVDRKQLDLQVSRLAGPSWTWDMTAAWQHLWELLGPQAPLAGQNRNRTAPGREGQPEH